MLTVSRYDWDSMAADLKYGNNLQVNKQGLIKGAVFLQRLIRAGGLYAHALTGQFLADFVTSSIEHDGDIKPFFAGHRDKMPGIDPAGQDAAEEAMQIAREKKISTVSPELSFAYVTNAIACSREDLPRQIARRFDEVFLAAANYDPHADVFGLIPRFKDTLLSIEEREQQKKHQDSVASRPQAPIGSHDEAQKGETDVEEEDDQPAPQATIGLGVEQVQQEIQQRLEALPSRKKKENMNMEIKETMGKILENEATKK